MKTIEELAQVVVKTSCANIYNGEFSEAFGRLGTPYCTAEDAVQDHINFFLGDMFSLIKNIQETSVNDLDKQQRLDELSNKIGLKIPFKV